MPLCRIEIEQLAADRWVCELEAGHDWRARAKRLNGCSFDDLMEQVIDTYREFVPIELKAPPVIPSPPLEPFPMTHPTPVPRHRRQRRGSRGEMV